MPQRSSSAQTHEPRSRFVEQLAERCRQHLLAEKWLIAPSLRVGRQWLEQVARTGAPVVNVQVRTLPELALDLADAADPDAEFLTDAGSAVLSDRLLGRLRAGGATYLSMLRPGAGLARSFAQSIAALQLAGLDNDPLPPDAFEHPAKAAELQTLMTDWDAALTRYRCRDYARALVEAVAAVRSPHVRLPADLAVLVPDDLALSRREQQLLGALPARRYQVTTADGACRSNRAPTDAERLRWLATPDEAPPPRRDGTAQVFRAVGEVNEVREALRRCLAQGWRLDEVELLHTDRDTYVPLIYELFTRLYPDGASHSDALPVTFAEGVPVRYARPARALRLWLDWIRGDYPQEGLVALLQEALVKVPQPDGDTFSFTRLANWLRRVPIGRGRDRYLALLDTQIAAIQEPAAWAETERRGLETVRGYIAELLQAAPPPRADVLTILRAAETFLDQHAHAASELDHNGRLMLLQQVRDLAHWIGQDNEPIHFDVWSWLADLPDDCRVLGKGPRPGCLHVGHVNGGGHTGRPHLFVIGLDDTRLPGTGLQDPLLLDSERQRLSPELPTVASRLRRQLDDFARLLARPHRTVTLGFCCSSLRDDRAMFPGPVVLAAHRLISGNSDADQGDLLDALASPASFAPTSPEGCLDESEWWLWRLCGPAAVANVEGLVAQRFPHLGRGYAAAALRTSDAFTVHDGLVPAAGRDHDPLAPDGPVMSASRLETIGRCPRAYFFQYLLGLEPPDEPEADPQRWLDGAAFGSLLHTVFEQFGNELLSEDRAPVLSRDWRRLSTILDEQVRSWRHRCAAPSESAFTREYRELQQAALVFLREEEEYGKTGPARPAFLEAAIGMANPGRGTVLDCAEPVAIALPNGQAIRVRGWIDRLDRILADLDTFIAWDYKTGSPAKYKRTDPFQQGRVLQPALYPAIANARLCDVVAPRARVTRFGFFFPGRNGRGERIEWTERDLADGPRVLLQLCQVAGSGGFPATNHKDDCRYCHFQRICGDAETVAAVSRRKLANPDNVVLQPFLALRPNQRR